MAAGVVGMLLSGCGGAAKPSGGASNSSTTGSASSTAASAAATKPLTLVKIGGITPTEIPLLPYYVAQDTGLFRKAGLKVQLVYTNPTINIAALHSGKVAYVALIDSISNGVEKGFPFRAVAVSSVGLSDAIVGQKSMHALSDLRGQTVVAGSTAASTPGRAAVTYLSQHGLPPGVIHVTYAANAASIALLTTGKVGGIMTDTARAIVLQGKGYPMLADLLKNNPVPSGGVGTTLQEIKQHPAQVRAVVDAILQATAVIHGNEKATVPIIEAHYKLNATDAAELWTDIHATFTPTGRASAAGIKLLLASDRRDLHLASTPSVGSVFDNAFLPPAGGTAG